MFKLKLNNYRGFLEEEFDFSRINILIGENSAGKSSIFKFLLALKQSMSSPNNRDYNLTLSGEETDLGNYYETIYNHEVDRNLSFSFEFGKEYFDFFLQDAVSITNKNNTVDTVLEDEVLEERNKITQLLGGKIVTSTTITCKFSNDLANHHSIATTIYNAEIGKISITYPLIEQDIYVKGKNHLCNIIFEDSQNNNYIFNEIEYGKIGFTTMIDSDSLKGKIRKDFEVDKAEIIFWKIAFLLITQNYIRNILSGVKYINPLLSDEAKRVYLKRDEKNNFNIKNIEEVVYLLSGENFLKNKGLENFKQDYTKVLSEFGLLDEIKVNKENFTRELRVVVGGMENNIKDVGFGVSLQLPIFAQAIISEKTTRMSSLTHNVNNGETLLIEQPEVHLHPRLQGKFIETLLSIGNNNIYFVETHSEHIIRMLQVLVKTKKFDLKSDDISIHYFRKEGKKMSKSLHKIEEDGVLMPNFPKGFYDVSYNLALTLMD